MGDSFLSLTNSFSKTPCPNQRIGLTAIRNAATVLSTIFLYVVAWYFLGSRERGESERIGPEDDDAFRSIVFVSEGLRILVFMNDTMMTTLCPAVFFNIGLLL